MTTATELPLATQLLRQITREIWIVTAADGARRGGLTATWVHPVALADQRPMLLAAIAANHFTAELIDASQSFTAHWLEPRQQALALQMATTSGRDVDKLAGYEVATAPSGSPRLVDCHAWFDCRVVAKYSTGDRFFYWADIIACGQPGTGPALTDQAFFAAARPEELQQLGSQLQADLAIQLPLAGAWRDGLATR